MHDPGVHSCGHMKGKVLEKLVLREGWSRVHAHVDMKGNVSEKLVLREGWSRVHAHVDMKGNVSEKLVFREGWSRVHARRYEGECFRKIGLKRGVVQEQGFIYREV